MVIKAVETEIICITKPISPDNIKREEMDIFLH